MRRRGQVNQPVTATMAVEISNVSGRSVELTARFSYEPSDPFAVTVTFRDPGGSVPWTFGRDLLLDGLYEPVGDGDVHVWPGLSVTGEALVVIELESNDGSVLAHVPARRVAKFVAQTLSAVPRGRELDQYDVDAALIGILA